MSEEMLSDQMDANELESSVPAEELSQETESPEVDPGIEQNEPAPEDDFASRFDQHPRFQELNNNLKAEREALQAEREARIRLEEQFKQFQEMQQQSQPKPEDELRKKLAELDKEHGSTVFSDMLKSAESVTQLQAQMEEFQQMRAQQEAEKVREQAVSQINELHEKHQVPSELRDMYNRQIEAIASQDPNLTLKDLPNLYEQVHKPMEAFLRSQKASYVQTAKSGTVPTAPKAPAAARNEKGQFTKQDAQPQDRDQILADIAQSAVKGHREANNL